MNFFLLVTLVLGIALTAVVVLRRKKKNASRSGRYRSPMGGGLNLERPGLRRRKGLRSFSLQPRHVLLSAVLLGMISWVASGYFLSDGEPANIVYERVADAATPEQYTSIGGQIFTGTGVSISNHVGGNLSANSGQVQAAMSVNASGASQVSSLQSAAQAALPASSQLDQVGLMAGKSVKTAAAAPKKASNNQASAAAASGAAKAAAPKAPAPKAASGTMAAAQKPNNQVTAAKASTAAAQAKTVAVASVSTTPPTAAKPKPQLAGNKQAAPRGLLSASRQYTVHLGSFGEKGNAENYLARLVAAGEKAFISESNVDGRLWHRVMSGSFTSRDDAETHGRNLKRRGLTNETGQYLVKSID